VSESVARRSQARMGVGIVGGTGMLSRERWNRMSLFVVRERRPIFLCGLGAIVRHWRDL
jgi:hypothetical protein